MFVKNFKSVFKWAEPHLKKILNPALANFYLFSTDTIKDQKSLSELQKFFVDLNNIVDDKSNLPISAVNLGKLIDNLPALGAKISQFFEQSKDNAIKNSHDTKSLKELLEI